MKKLVMFFFILLCYVVNSITVEIDNPVIEKGETVRFFGSCQKQLSVKVSATIEKIPVIDSKFKCPDNGEWSIPHEIDFLVPSGNMKVAFTQGNEEITTNIQVRPSRESSFFVTDFFTEPPKIANRLDQIVLDLNLLENKTPVRVQKFFFGIFLMLGKKCRK